jgi:hypothetical protein
MPMQKPVRRGSHTAVRVLEKAMLDYLDQRNENPKPFVNQGKNGHLVCVLDSHGQPLPWRTWTFSGRGLNLHRRA